MQNECSFILSSSAGHQEMNEREKKIYYTFIPLEKASHKNE